MCGFSDPGRGVPSVSIRQRTPCKGCAQLGDAQARFSWLSPPVASFPPLLEAEAAFWCRRYSGVQSHGKTQGRRVRVDRPREAQDWRAGRRVSGCALGFRSVLGSAREGVQNKAGMSFRFSAISSRVLAEDPEAQVPTGSGKTASGTNGPESREPSHRQDFEDQPLPVLTAPAGSGI